MGGGINSLPKGINYLWKETEEIINRGAFREGRDAGTGRHLCFFARLLQLFELFFFFFTMYINYLVKVYIFAYVYI